jgi:transposase InsO family protein
VSVAARFEFIEAHRGEFSIEAMCRTLVVSRSGYYAYRKRPQPEHARRDEELADSVAAIFAKGRGTYGAPRVYHELRRGGCRTSKRRVARLLREQGLRATTPPRYVVTTDSRHDEPIAPNVLARDFSASAPDQKWAGDITYVRTGEGWLYLAVFLDLFSRRVIGWAMGSSLDASLAQSALAMALLARQPKGALLVHSDRGVQYAAGAFRQMLADWSITPSMSRRGNCYDNAVSESFFATLKKELVHRCRFATRAEAESAIFEFIEAFYNRSRLHSTIGYLPPVEFEQLWLQHRVSTAESATVGNPSPTEGFSTGVDVAAGCGTQARFSTT